MKKPLQIKQVAPVWLQDYAPGFSMYTLKQDDIISEGMAWFMSQDAPLEFAKLLKQGFNAGLSHVISVETATQGIEATVGGVQRSDLNKYFDDPSYIVVCREPKHMTNEDLMMMQAYERSLIGKDYDYGVLPWFAFMSLTGIQKYSKKLREMTPVGHKDNAWVCSSFKADGYFHTNSFRDCDLFNEWNIYGIHVNRLFLSFPYKFFKIGEVREWI